MGEWGQPPRTCARTHACACACMRNRHDNFMQMAAPIGISHWEFPMISYVRARVCACMRARARACAHMRGGCPHPPPPPPNHPPPPPPNHPPTPWAGTPQISKNAIRFERIEIFRFRLKIWNLRRLPHPWLGDFFGGWMGGLVGRNM